MLKGIILAPLGYFLVNYLAATILFHFVVDFELGRLPEYMSLYPTYHCITKLSG